MESNRNSFLFPYLLYRQYRTDQEILPVYSAVLHFPER